MYKGQGSVDLSDLQLNIHMNSFSNIKSSERVNQELPEVGLLSIVSQREQISQIGHATKVTPKKYFYSSCQVCFTFEALKTFFYCEHRSCINCLNKQVNRSIKQFQIIRCLSGCRAEIDESVLQLSVADKKKYNKIKQLKFAEEQQLKTCPICVQEIGILTIKEGLDKKLGCARCDQVFCAKCLLSQHKGQCNNNLEILLEDGFQMSVCPNCNSVIQKVEGCKHIKCRCKTQFCYICQQLWVRNHECNNGVNKKKKRLEDLKKKRDFTKEQYRVFKEEQKRKQEEKRKKQEQQLKRKQEQRLKLKQQAETKKRIQQYKQKQTKVVRELNQRRERKSWLTSRLYDFLLNSWDNANLGKKMCLVIALIFGELFLVIGLAICILLNMVLGWLLILPIAQLILSILTQSSRGNFQRQCQCSKIFERVSHTISHTGLYLGYFLFLPSGITAFTSKFHIFDIVSIIKGEAPLLFTWRSLTFSSRQKKILYSFPWNKAGNYMFQTEEGRQLKIIQANLHILCS